MVTQKPILVKLDIRVALDLDAEVALGHVKRNRAINDAVKIYLDMIERVRRARALGVTTLGLDDMRDFLERWHRQLRVR